MNIEIISLRLVDSKESGLRGFADVKLDSILIRDFRIFQRSGRKNKLTEQGKQGARSDGREA